MKRVALSLCLLMVSLLSLGQSSPEKAAPRPLFADKPKFGLLEAKVGRSFLRKEEHFTESAQVFFGGVGLGAGLLSGNTLIGIGGTFEYIDMLDDSYSFPLYVLLRHGFGENTRNGFYVAAKAGYILGGERTFSVSYYYAGSYWPGTCVRSMRGPYGEVQLGYCYRGYDFFVSYNYRVINYETQYVYNSPIMPSMDSEWKKAMHTVMGGVGFRLF